MSPYGDMLILSPYGDKVNVSPYGDMEALVHVHTTQTLGAVIRGHRRRRGMTQAAVAKAAGVSRSWMTELEAGKPTVELARVLAVLDALDIVMDLRTDEPQAGPSETSEIDLDSMLEQYQKGNDEDA